MQSRIAYNDGVYYAIDSDDIEARHLIEYLGFNKHELAVDRANHIERIKSLLDLCEGDKTLLIQFFQKDRFYLSFSTALEAEFQMDLTELLFT